MSYTISRKPVGRNVSYPTATNQTNRSPYYDFSRDTASSDHSSTILSDTYRESPFSPDQVIRYTADSFETSNSDKHASTFSAATESFIEKPGTRNNREFHPSRQLIHLLRVGFIRFMFTAVFVAGLCGTILYYERKTYMDNRLDKKLFNFLTTSQSMLLGISIASGFKQVAINIRWRILSQKPRPLREVDGILRLESLTNLFFMGITKLRSSKVKTMLSPILWVLVNIAGQAGVAMLALTYSLDPILVSTPASMGEVKVTNMSTFYAGGGMSFEDPYFNMTNQLAAHMYGEMALNYIINSTDLDDPTQNSVQANAPWGDEQYTFFAGPNYTQYIFKQMSFTGQSPIGSFYSNRSIFATSSCNTYTVVKGANGTSNTIGFTREGQPAVQDFQMVEPHSTTYYTDIKVKDCGPRCANVCAFENNGSNGFYYECEISISTVTNVYHPAQELSDSQAQIAAASIALQGYQTNTSDAQFQRYPKDFKYGNFLRGDGNKMAALMREYAIGTIVTADNNNKCANISLQGSTPTQGVVLRIEHKADFYAMLFAILAVQFILFVGGAFWANKVVVVDESYLSTALLLSPLVSSLHSRSWLDGEEVSEALGDKKVRYGCKSVLGERGMARKLQFAGDGVSRGFPPGEYV